MSLYNVPGLVQLGATAVGVTNWVKGRSVAQSSFDDGNSFINMQATLEEVHHSTLEVTEHPVQSGAAITDHSYNRPVEVVLKCAWSNSSVSGLVTGATNLKKRLLNGAEQGEDYISGIYTQLMAFKEARKLISIVTSLKFYENMLITQIQITRDVKSFNALMCSITCREVIIVDTLAGAVPVADQPLASATAAPLDLGSQSLLDSGVGTTPVAVPGLQWAIQ